MLMEPPAYPPYKGFFILFNSSSDDSMFVCTLYEEMATDDDWRSHDERWGPKGLDLKNWKKLLSQSFLSSISCVKVTPFYKLK